MTGRATQVLDIDKLCPWDFTLVLGGIMLETAEPDVGQIRDFSRLEEAVTSSGEAGEGIEDAAKKAKAVAKAEADAMGALRASFKAITPPAAHRAIDQAEFGNLQIALRSSKASGRPARPPRPSG